MVDFKRPTFDDAPAPEKVLPEITVSSEAPTKFKRPIFEAPAQSPQEKAQAGLAEQSANNKAMFNGLTFGLGDRIRALTGIGVEGKNYDERLAKTLGERETYNQENPVSHYFTEGLPGVLTGAPVVSGIKAGLGAVAPGLMQFAEGSGALPAIARTVGNAALGAGFGAVGGAGSAKPGEMVDGAEHGAMFGAGTAVGLQGLGSLVKSGIGLLTPMAQKVMMMMGVQDPAKWADKKMVEELLASGHTPESIVLKMKDMANQGAWKPQSPDFMGPPTEVPAKPVVMADALPAKVLGMMKKAGTDKGGGAEIIQSKLGQRAVEAPDRIANDIATNISDRTGASAEAGRIIQERSDLASPLYKKASDMGTLSADVVNPFFNTGFRKNLFKEVEGVQNSLGQPFEGKMTVNPKTQELEIVKTPSIADLHTMRTDLSKARAGLWNSTENNYVGKASIGGSKYDAGQLKTELQSLTNHIETLTGGPTGPYAEARKIFADESSVLSAVRKGTNIIRTRPEDVAIEFGKLKSEAERDAYRSGISSVLTDKTGSTSSGASILKSIFGNKNIRSKLDEVYPNDGARALFPKQMAAEQKMQDTTRILSPRSVSHDFLESGGDASLPAALANAAAGRPVAAAANAARFIAGQADRMTPQYGEQLARLGMMSLPETETFAANVARQTNSPFAKAGRIIKGGLSAAAGAVPFVGGNLASRGDEKGALERLRNMSESK
jgi:hypothetical protein